MFARKIKIKGKTWEVKVISKEKMLKEHPGHENSDGFCRFKDRTCFIIYDGFTPATIFHEQLHMYAYECEVESCYLTPDQTEELCAEIIGNNYYEMAATTHRLIKDLLPKIKKYL